MDDSLPPPPKPVYRTTCSCGARVELTRISRTTFTLDCEICGEHLTVEVDGDTVPEQLLDN